jgi:hypothetical protein
MNVVHSKLKLKGVKPAVKRVKPDEPIELPEETIPNAVVDQPIKKGIGKIIVSGTTVHGMDTDFLKELKKGDSIIIDNNNRAVAFILSNKSLSIEESFPSDIVTYTAYNYKKMAVVVEKKTSKEILEITKPKEEAPKFREVEMRVSGGLWTYKKAKKVLDNTMTKEQELDVRVKNVRDKFCWC